ncbi:MAG: hypothetical protein JWM34_4053 [Ilumatobacteraceae bacterium]|nr:hypothetical protein [Ilumatobacteraceae bacterium]
MSVRFKHLGAAVCSIALLASCGSDSKSSPAVTTPATATTSTAAPVATTTPASSAATVTIATVAPETVPATEAPITVATVVTSTETAGSTATSDSTVSTGSTADGGPDYTPVSPPTVPTTSAAVVASGTEPDGVYYGTVTEGSDATPSDDNTVAFQLVQLFRGDDCTAHFGAEDQDSCVNDYGVETEPSATLEVPLTDQYITVSDAATQKSYQISGDELYGLIHGDDPSGGPDDYLYSGFGFVITIKGGAVTRLEQWWTP